MVERFYVKFDDPDCSGLIYRADKQTARHTTPVITLLRLPSPWVVDLHSIISYAC